MSEKFIVSDWFAKRAKLNIQLFTVEDIDFELMALDKEALELVESCESYEEIISLAADYGISYSRKRVMDDAELSKDLDLLWGLDSLDVDLDPCIKYRVGEKVCEISGLTQLLNDTLESEKAIDGDNLPAGDVTLAELELDANAATTLQATA